MDRVLPQEKRPYFWTLRMQAGQPAKRKRINRGHCYHGEKGREPGLASPGPNMQEEI